MRVVLLLHNKPVVRSRPIPKNVVMARIRSWQQVYGETTKPCTRGPWPLPPRPKAEQVYGKLKEEAPKDQFFKSQAMGVAYEAQG